MLTKRGYLVLTSLPMFMFLSLIVPRLSYASILISILILVDYLIFKLRIRSASKLMIFRKLSKERIYLGEVVEVELYLKGKRGLGTLSVFEKHSKNLDVVGDNPFRVDLEYSSEASIKYLVKATGLGKAVLKGAEVVIRDPLDLFNKSLLMEVKSELKVRPRSGLRGFPSKKSGLHESFKGRFGPEFDGVREYFHSEDYRLIAWKLVAKRGVDKLLVKKLSGDLNLNIVFILDSSAGMDFGFKGLRKIDYAINSVINVSSRALMDGNRVTIVTYPSMRVFRVRGGVKSIPKLVDFLSEVEVVDFERVGFKWIGGGIYFCILDENTYFKVRDELRGLALRGVKVFTYVLDSLKLLKLKVRDEASEKAFKFIIESFKSEFREEFTGFLRVRAPELSELTESILRDYLSVRRIESTIK